MSVSRLYITRGCLVSLFLSRLLSGFLNFVCEVSLSLVIIFSEWVSLSTGWRNILFTFNYTSTFWYKVDPNSFQNALLCGQTAVLTPPRLVRRVHHLRSWRLSGDLPLNCDESGLVVGAKTLKWTVGSCHVLFRPCSDSRRPTNLVVFEPLLGLQGGLPRLIYFLSGRYFVLCYLFLGPSRETCVHLSRGSMSFTFSFRVLSHIRCESKVKRNFSTPWFIDTNRDRCISLWLVFVLTCPDSPSPSFPTPCEVTYDTIFNVKESCGNNSTLSLLRG